MCTLMSVLGPWLSLNSSAFLTGMGVGSFGVQAGSLSAFGLWPLAVASCTHPKKSPTQCIMEFFIACIRPTFTDGSLCIVKEHDMNEHEGE